MHQTGRRLAVWRASHAATQHLTISAREGAQTLSQLTEAPIDMAYAADINTASASHAGERRGIFTRIFDGLVAIAENNHRVRRVQYLSRLSDAELEARGLKRDDIARHVFSDVFYV